MSSAHGGSAAPPTRLRGPLTRVGAAPKLVLLVAFLVAVGLTPNHAGLALIGWLAVAALAGAIAYVEWRSVLARLALDVPLAVLAVVQALVGRGPDVHVLGIGLSRPGLTLGLGVLAKATIGVLAVSAVAASTTLPETLAGLRRLGLPAWFCRMLGLAARQVDLLRAELDRLRLAAALRAGRTSRRRTATVAAGSLGTLLVRATERADRLQLAADLRGGTLEHDEPA